MLAFRDVPDGDGGDRAAVRAPKDALAPPGGAALACAACGTRITSRAAAITISGQHEHTCTNPHGYRYVIGCFAAAEGLVAVGVPTLEYTWFPGYSWQVQNCATCEDLLGWRFQGADGGFYGLIAMRLVEVDTN